MKKYQILINEIEMKTVIENTYIREEDRKDSNQAYQDIAVEKEISTKIYEQKSSGDIQLKSIIDAFNQAMVADKE